MQNFYHHSKGWYVMRPKSISDANKIAERMIALCNNPNYGYDQYGRLGVITNGIDSKKKSECDCSSSVRACVKEATGVDPGNFITDNEVQFLEKTGLFEKAVKYTPGMKLYPGDILVTCTRGHTVIVCKSDYSRSSASAKAKKPTIEQAAINAINGTYGNGTARITALKKLGFSLDEIKQIQEQVNKILKEGSRYYPKYTGTSTNIDTVFKAIGVSAGYRGNWKKRKPIAKANGFLTYTGSATENLTLIELAKKGKLKKA